ncbi:MAG: metal-sulfur cluster assembly factor, partial [Alkalibacterium gilvum]
VKPISDIKETQVKLVWYPAWDPSRMSRYARIALGIR